MGAGEDEVCEAMNDEMKAAARVIISTRTMMSEGTATCPRCRQLLDQHTVTPDVETDALHKALDAYDTAARRAIEESERITSEQDWWNWFTGEDDEDGPNRNQRFTRLCNGTRQR